jgi:gluconolactonase
MTIDLGNVAVIASGLDHPEGIAVLSTGDVVAGGEAGQLYRIRDGAVDVVHNTGGFILGLAADADDRILVADQGNHCVWLWTPDGGLSTASTGPSSSPFTNCNAIAIGRFGAYVSNSGTWNGATGFIALVRPDGSSVVASVDVARYPNGVALSPDDAWLYAVESNFGIVRCRIQGDGLLGAPETVVAMPNAVPDGVLFDGDGGLLITCYQPNSVYRWVEGVGLTELVHDPQAMVLSMPTNGAWLEDGRLGLANLGGWHLSAVRVPFSPGLPTTHAFV